jgi:hypothetical protein
MLLYYPSQCRSVLQQAAYLCLTQCGKNGKSLMKDWISVVCFLLLALSLRVEAGDCLKDQYGNVVCGKGQCATDQYGKVLCAQEGGGAIRDRLGVVKCGVGSCAMDVEGQVKCSTKAGGGAAIDSNGKVKCLDGCQNGSEQRCESAR